MSLTSKVRSTIAKLRSTELTSDGLWGLGSQGFSLASGIVAFSLLGRSLGSAGYGDYSSLYAITGPLGNLVSGAIPLALMQHVIRDREPLSSSIRSCLSLSILIGTALAIAGVIVAGYVVPTFPITTSGAILLLEFVVMPVTSLSAAAIQSVSGYRRSIQVRLIAPTVRLILILILSATGQLTVAKLGAIYLGIAILMSSATLIMTARSYEFTPLPGPIDRSHIRTSVQYSLGMTAIAVQNDGDKVVMSAYGFREETGLYAAGYRIVQLGLVPVEVLVQASHNRFLEHEEGRKDQHLHRSLAFARVVAVYGTVFTIIVIAIAPLLPHLVGEEFEGSVEMVRWLSPLVLLRGLALFPLNGLLGLGRTLSRSMLLASTAVISLAMYIMLVPSMSWRGAAIGTTVGEALLALGAWTCLFYFQRRDNARIDDDVALAPSDTHDFVADPGMSSADGWALGGPPLGEPSA